MHLGAPQGLEQAAWLSLDYVRLPYTMSPGYVPSHVRHVTMYARLVSHEDLLSAEATEH